MKYLYLFLLISTLAATAHSQNVLVAKKTNSLSHHIFKPGEDIQLRSSEGEKISGPINAIRHDYIIVDFTHRIALHDIETIYVSRRFLALSGSYLTGISVLYAGLDLLNNGFDTHNNGLKVAAAGITLGMITSKLLSRKRLSTRRGKWHFEILSSKIE